MSIVRWNLKEANSGRVERSRPKANLWPDEKKSHIRPSVWVRLHRKSKPNNCTEHWMVDAAGIREKERVSTRGDLADGETRSNNELREVSRGHSTIKKKMERTEQS